MKANYEEDKVIVSATEPTGVNRKKVWFKKGKNIANIPFALNNKKIMTATYDDYYETTDYSVYLIAGKTYTLSFESDGTAGSSAGTDTVQIMLLLDKKYDTMFYSTDSKILTFTVAISGNYYFRFDVNKNGCTHSFWNIQLEQNPVATTYEAYIEPEIYILNSNDVYERFYSKSELNKEHYSTGEQKIGTWIDGKNLYRKVIFKTVKITANTNLVINSEIQNIDTITKIDGVISSSLKNNYRQINTYNLENNAISISMSASTNGNITIYSTDDWATPNIIITLEYTKTTD